MSQGQPSQEELRAYLEQLRDADVTEILLQAYSVLGTGAEVKLGRPDARVVIDALAGLLNAVQGKVDPQLHERMREGVVQLQTAQVQLEREEAASAGAPADAEGADAGAAAGEPSAESPTSRPSGQPAAGQPGAGPGGQRMTDRLWIPGRDPEPPRPR